MTKRKNLLFGICFPPAQGWEFGVNFLEFGVKFLGCHPSEPPYNFFWNQICLFGRELGRITGYLTDVFTKSVKSPSLINSRSDSRPHCSDWMGRDSSRLWSRSRTPAGPPLNHRDVACTLEKRIVYSTSDMSTRGDGWRRVLAVAAA